MQHLGWGLREIVVSTECRVEEGTQVPALQIERVLRVDGADRLGGEIGGHDARGSQGGNDQLVVAE
ncbi:hypothetical protein [Nocardia barduliensis]|uniref:hypothetical protein n=1 Tax=Nocardia barduliensis TaxID=2736643 RepID=UPI001572EFAC|nr:hypothetical protein [Nocardia barduliensis]